MEKGYSRRKFVRRAAGLLLPVGLGTINTRLVRAQEPPVDVPKPTPLVLPERRIVQPEPMDGEGEWTTEGLPHSLPEDMLMVRTFVRPDIENPSAVVGVLLLDKRRIRLNLVGGTQPDGTRLGAIPDVDGPNLLVAFNGGFQLGHGDWGMFANGIEYKTLRKGRASVVMMKDGTIKMGTWGEGELVSRTDDMLAVRQNIVLMVDNSEITPAARDHGKDNNIWGNINVSNPSEITTWRSGIGLTKEGNLILAYGSGLIGGNLAAALQAAGAYTAMQLDINSPYSQMTLAVPQPDGSITNTNFMSTMPGSPDFFKGTHMRDFFYITLDETNYKP